MGVNPRNIQLPGRGALGYPAQAMVVGVLWGVGLYAELYFLRKEAHRMTRFRDKSALFGKVKGPDDPPSWGPPGPYKAPLGNLAVNSN